MTVEADGVLRIESRRAAAMPSLVSQAHRRSPPASCYAKTGLFKPPPRTQTPAASRRKRLTLRLA